MDFDMGILILVVVILAILVVEELSLAFIYYPLWTGKSYYQLIKKNEPAGFIIEYDPKVGYTLKPNLRYSNPTPPLKNAPRRITFFDVQTGPEGFSFTENIKKLKKSYKLIYCIGGSTTQGAESHYGKTYPAVLDQLVKKYGYRCVNTGVGGHRSIHERLLFEWKILPLKPQAIIIFSGYNDFEDCAYNWFEPGNPFKHCQSHNVPASYLQNILRFSALFHFSKERCYHMMGWQRTESIVDNYEKKMKALNDTLNSDAWVKEWEKNIGFIIDTCKSRKIDCYLISHISPTYENASEKAKVFADNDLNMDGRFEIFVEYIKRINKLSYEICRAKGIKYIDVTNEFDQHCRLDNGNEPYVKRFSLFVDRMHFTEDGNKLLATFIFEQIKGHL